VVDGETHDEETMPDHALLFSYQESFSAERLDRSRQQVPLTTNRTGLRPAERALQAANPTPKRLVDVPHHLNVDLPTESDKFVSRDPDGFFCVESTRLVIT
jgi:hypothetical protein